MRIAFVSLMLLACGATPAKQPPPPAAAAASPAPVPTGRAVRVVRIEPSILDPIAKTDLTTAKKWGADPANALSVLPVFRHILVKAPKGNAEASAAARKKAEDLLARLGRGEDFATLAKSSDDPGSANKGGAYPGSMVK